VRSSRVRKCSFRNAREWDVDVEVDGGESNVWISREVAMVVVGRQVAMITQ